LIFPRLWSFRPSSSFDEGIQQPGAGSQDCFTKLPPAKIRENWDPVSQDQIDLAYLPRQMRSLARAAADPYVVVPPIWQNPITKINDGKTTMT
jgi:hypothetical protein